MPRSVVRLSAGRLNFSIGDQVRLAGLACNCLENKLLRYAGRWPTAATVLVVDRGFYPAAHRSAWFCFESEVIDVDKAVIYRWKIVLEHSSRRISGCVV